MALHKSFVHHGLANAAGDVCEVASLDQWNSESTLKTAVFAPLPSAGVIAATYSAAIKYRSQRSVGVFSSSLLLVPQPSYSYLNATMGSTLVARWAGM